MNKKRREIVAELKRDGMSPKEAYEASKKMKTFWKHKPATSHQGQS